MKTRSSIPALFGVLSCALAANVSAQSQAVPAIAPSAAPAALTPSIAAAFPVTPYASMVKTNSPAANQGWTAAPIFTVGETLGSYQPVGILDGLGALSRGTGSAVVLANHELPQNSGYTYSLLNGTQLRGARVSSFVVTRTITAGVPSLKIERAGLAYNTVYDRQFQVVTEAAQINETGISNDGFSRFCSSTAVAKGTYGFVDDIYFTGEETGKPFHPHGGTLWALDAFNRELWAVPALGRANWENVSPLETGNPGTIALLVGDDTESAPLYLYIGQKNALGDGSFLDRNGLRVGTLYAWKADNGDLTPEHFNGLNASRTGQFVPVVVQNAAQAGQPGHDAEGYLDIDTLQAQADALGCFSFSRPEDIGVNPLDGTQAAIASTGRGQLFPSDNWGDVLVIDVDFSNLSADLVIVHDADELLVPDSGIRNPDNLTWAKDGKIYVQEDRSTSPSALFGAATGIEASMYSLDPVTRAFRRVAECDRSAVAPLGTTDGAPNDIGNWESSGVIDVTGLLPTLPNERLLLITVQAHSLVNGPIGDNALLDEGGQLILLSKIGQ
jgi:hypothetical protein